MKKPQKRTDIPPRMNDNYKRRLAATVADQDVASLLAKAKYGGSPKHKRNPKIFGLEPFNGERGDATLCDEHAKFQPADMPRIGKLMARGINARLVGSNIWTVDDSGWIFEARLTNVDQDEYHAYPVRPKEAIAEPVYRRFKAWAEQSGQPSDKQAAENCASLYGLKP